MDKHLHIISLDVPWPANYGGVIDVFYKIVALHKASVKIHLHCFTKDRAAQPELNKYCEAVYYYPRKKSFSLSQPYIIHSRNDDRLLKNLREDDHPILMESIHSTYLLDKDMLPGRKVFVRLQNVEFKYYNSLALHEGNILKKIYFLTESRLLKKYEASIAGKAMILALSKDDMKYYSTEFTAKSLCFIPAFLPGDKVISKEGKGSFCLYHGNLSVNENEKAALWLVKNIFSNTNIPLVIAGKNPSKKLQAFAEKNSNICIVANPDDNALQDLISKAQVNVLPSFNSTGIKLKLLNALFNGRFCVVNTAAVSGSGLKDLCICANDPESFKQQVTELFQQNFTLKIIDERTILLEQLYNNDKNAAALISLLY